MFFAAAAKRMGFEVVAWDPDPGAPVRSWADEFICAEFTDRSALTDFLRGTRGATYEWENIPVPLVESIEAETPVYPGSRILRLFANRISEKRYLEKRGFPVTPFESIKDAGEVTEAARRLGFPCVLKTTTSGYDGRGQWRLDRSEDAATWRSSSGRPLEPIEWILERWVPDAKELSAIVARDVSGRILAYPVSENRHENGILRISLVPAEIDPEQARRAGALAREVVASLEGPGVFGIEMFLKGDGEILVNEVAPRPHNTGHYTLDVCPVSQFDQQVRIVAGLPVSPAPLLSPAALVNILGPEILWVRSMGGQKDLFSMPGVRLYDYRKQTVRPGRKMGHLLAVHSDPREAARRAEEIASRLSTEAALKRPG